MGNYTELNIRCWLKEDIPTDVMDVLYHMSDTRARRLPNVNELSHPLFLSYNWNCIMESGSYYFPGVPYSYLRLDPYTNVWSLVIRGDTKNYDHEYELFLHFIQPYIADYGFIGYLINEEDEEPTLIYNTEDGIKLCCKDKVVWLDSEWLAETKDKLDESHYEREVSSRKAGVW